MHVSGLVLVVTQSTLTGGMVFFSSIAILLILGETKSDA